MSSPLHIPVLLDEVVESLQIKAGGIYMDGTLGLAGHAKAILDKAQGKITYLGFDRDQIALAHAKANLAEYPEQLKFFHSNYSDFAQHLVENKITKINGALLDLGVSSMQLDFAERGFSYHLDADLDMRMNSGSNGSDYDAKDFVNKAKEDEIKKVIELYGEEPLAGRIAKSIVETRQKKAITTTKELADIVYMAYPAKWRRTARNHPATRTFQAIRIQVNNELGEVETFLNQILAFLDKGARLSIISFHSLEDRIVKQMFKL